ncbi:MAG: isopeptide-forming domain-containing fimbrial protein [Clostridia bacterium]|nr:isopeptide-forming domain-containing fimbrial protein [Clostridia bacterium]
MKKTRKILAIVLALVLAFALSMAVFAVNDSITITGAKEGETYSLYKLLELVVDDETNPSAYSYTVNSDWAEFFAAPVAADPTATPPVEAVAAGPGYQYVTINAQGYVTAISDAAALAKAADEWTGKPATPVQTVTVASDETTAVFSNLPDGYWLISSTLGTARMTETTPDDAAVTIAEKNPEDTVDKKVQEDSSSTYVDSNDAQVGDTVNFQSTVTLLPNTTNVVYHDTMDPGLTFDTTSVTVTVGGTALASTYYTVNTNPGNGETFTVTFTQAYLDTISASTDVVISYSATLNENAAQTTTTTGEEPDVTTTTTAAINPQTNEAHVTFGNNQETTHETTTTTTHKFSVYKHATGSTENLADAVFSLKKNGTVVPLVKIDDNNYRVANPSENATTTNTFTTVASGDIVIWGVDADNDYTLEEITPPDGYNALGSEVNVTVDAGNATRIDVENSTGSELPSTGGYVLWIYIIGAVLVLGAGILLVAKKRTGATVAE